MATLRLGGLASGLDTESLITQLLAAERGGRTRYQRQQDVVEARKSTLGDISSKLRALGTALADLRSPTLFGDVQAVESSDPAKVAFTRTGSVGTGTYLVDVLRVASSEQRSYAYVAPSGADSSITVGGHTTTIRDGASLADAIAAINADKDAKVFASDAGGGRIALSWRATGDVTTPNADGTPNEKGVVSGGALDLTPTNVTTIRTGRDAQLRIDDGAVVTQSSNTYTGLPGLTLELKAPATDVAVIVGSPGPDAQKITDKVKDAANRVDRGKGVLRGDAQLAGLQSALRQALQTTFGSTAAADQLSDLGITTGTASGGASFSRDAVNGRLVLDEAKLKATLQAEPTAAKALLGGSGSGFAQSMEAVLAPWTGTGGVFEERTRGADAELTRIRRSMTAFDERLELREKSLRAMFTRLEQSLASSQAQGSQLSSSLARL